MSNLIIQRSLIVRLTEDEVRTYSDELARVTTLQAEAEDEKKAVTSGFKDKIDRCIADSRSLARKISTRQELREVDCEWTLDFDRLKAFLYRKDTGEQVDSRNLTAGELQLNLAPIAEGATEAEEPPVQEPPPDSTPEQLEQAADAILEGAPPVPKVCALCGHAHGERYRIDGEDRNAPRRVWKTIENDQGTFEQCPKCAHLNSFPKEDGGKEGGEAA